MSEGLRFEPAQAPANARARGAKPKDVTQATLLGARKWASLRLQTLYRTLEGMMKNREALQMLLSAELPDASDEELLQILDSKFCCLAGALAKSPIRCELQEQTTFVSVWELPKPAQCTVRCTLHARADHPDRLSRPSALHSPPSCGAPLSLFSSAPQRCSATRASRSRSCRTS
eukprot:4369822-Prymnesium_polylepis.1